MRAEPLAGDAPAGLERPHAAASSAMAPIAKGRARMSTKLHHVRTLFTYQRVQPLNRPRTNATPRGKNEH